MRVRPPQPRVATYVQQPNGRAGIVAGTLSALAFASPKPVLGVTIEGSPNASGRALWVRIWNSRSTRAAFRAEDGPRALKSG